MFMMKSSFLVLAHSEESIKVQIQQPICRLLLKVCTKNITLVSSKKNVRKEVLDILHNEINVVKHLNHPHLVRTYDVYDTSDCLIVVMEICQNDLKHTISTKHLSE